MKIQSTNLFTVQPSKQQVNVACALIYKSSARQAKFQIYSNRRQKAGMSASESLLRSDERVRTVLARDEERVKMI